MLAGAGAFTTHARQHDSTTARQHDSTTARQHATARSSPRHAPVAWRRRCVCCNMWLDRFAAHSTPAGTPPPRGSSYSPAPRRSYPAPGPGPLPLPPRPGLNPTSSSLSLVSPGSSSTSLPSTARLPNGSARRRQGAAGAPPSGPDPLQVLEAVLGGPPRKPPLAKGEGAAGSVPKKPEDVVVHVDFGRLSLQAFAGTDPP